jgi:CubicO group peptidase (beta-lactamase class C family)
MMDLIDGQGLAYDSVLVVRHGAIVFEEYRNGYDREIKHHLQSATKSFSSMLIGIAIHEGLLESVKQGVIDLFPDHTIAHLDGRKQRLTLEHLLTMSDGMDWHELDYPYTDTRNTLGQMWASRDAVQHVLDRPMAREAGEAWAYNSGTSILLGGILEQATGQDVLSFAREYLFGPLGIEDVRWDKANGNHYHTDGGLYLTPRDMARFGYLMLRGGTWDGEEIVSPEWVARSTEAHYPTGSGKGYGYQWWTLEEGIFAAHGHYEQLIYVVPKADMVVVFTGNVPDSMIPPTDGLLYRYILAACTDLPPETTRRTYADHGFTFDYPIGFAVQEMPSPGQDAVTAAAGTVLFRLDAYPPEMVQVVWLQTEADPDLEAHLAAAFRSSSQQAGSEFTVGESQVSTRNGHRAVYQDWDLAQQDFRMRGVTVAWYCAESQRLYLFSYATNPEVPDQDLTARLQEHLASFGCHAQD